MFDDTNYLYTVFFATVNESAVTIFLLTSIPGAYLILEL